MKNKKEALEDARILEEQVQRNPGDLSSLFQLAKSYEMAEKYDLALKAFGKRAYTFSSGPELFLSFLGIARMRKFLAEPAETVFAAYCEAWEYAPQTQEPLFWMGEYFATRARHLLAKLTAQYALSLPKQPQCLIHDASIAEYRLLLLFATSAMKSGFKEEALIAWKQLLARNIPEEIRTVIQSNILTATQGSI